MHTKILNFIKYNNAFTIILGVCFLSFGISFAASPAVRDSVYSSSETVVSVDNSSIISADLDSFDFNLKINNVAEDDKNYYADYSYQTMVIEDGFWKNKTIEKTLKESKEALNGKDFGLYAAKELGDDMNYELSYLKRVQKLETGKGESHKVVTVTYSGLIGKLLNPKEKVIEGYNPVIAEVVPKEITVDVHKTKPQENNPKSETTPQTDQTESTQKSTSGASTATSSSEASIDSTSTSETSTSTDITATSTDLSATSTATSSETSIDSTSTSETSTSTDITATTTDSSSTDTPISTDSSTTTSTDTSSSTDNTSTTTAI